MTNLNTGDTFTIAGVQAPDRRWWPRLKAFVLRRPPPMRSELVRFEVVGEFVGDGRDAFMSRGEALDAASSRLAQDIDRNVYERALGKPGHA